MKPWKDGADNGGATAPGVTKDTHHGRRHLPNDLQLSMRRRHGADEPADNSKGTYQDAIHDYLLPLMKYYETWGRDIEMQLPHVLPARTRPPSAPTRSRSRPTKPFAVDGLRRPPASTCSTPRWRTRRSSSSAYATTTQKALAQAPYRWGQSDTQAAPPTRPR